jgi:hypothetical protein
VAVNEQAIVLAPSRAKLDKPSDVGLIGVDVALDGSRYVVALYEETFGTGMQDFKYRTGIDKRNDPIRSELFDRNREAFKARKSYGISRFAFHEERKRK